jgi:quinol monooxygenase YgiN
MMIFSMIKIMPHPDKGKDVLDILLSMKGLTLAAAGCLECAIASEDDDGAKWIIYLELWRSLDDLCEHIRSTLYQRLLEALELSVVSPQVCFFQVSAVQGMELIEAERTIGCV